MPKSILVDESLEFASCCGIATISGFTTTWDLQDEHYDISAALKDLKSDGYTMVLASQVVDGPGYRYFMKSRRWKRLAHFRNKNSNNILVVFSYDLTGKGVVKYRGKV